MNRSVGIYILAVTLAALGNGCSGIKTDANATGLETLARCPDRPNCVSSEASDANHAVESMQLKGDTATGWEGVRRVVGRWPRTGIVKATDRYLHVECKSRVFGFVDDLELLLDPVTGEVAIRSASRVGYSDLGVNRRRVEALRQELREEGIIH